MIIPCRTLPFTNLPKSQSPFSPPKKAKASAFPPRIASETYFPKDQARACEEAIVKMTFTDPAVHLSKKESLLSHSATVCPKENGVLIILHSPHKIGSGSFKQVKLCMNTATRALLKRSTIILDESDPSYSSKKRAYEAESRVAALVPTVRDCVVPTYLIFRRVVQRQEKSILKIEIFQPYHDACLFGVINLLTFPNMLRVAKDVAKAIKWFHERNLEHRDVKPENVFVNYNQKTGALTEVVLGDYDLVVEKNTPACLRVSGSCFYMAPELHQFAIAKSIFSNQEAWIPRLGTGVDIWSFGCLLATVALKGLPPWTHHLRAPEQLDLAHCGAIAMLGEMSVYSAAPESEGNLLGYPVKGVPQPFLTAIKACLCFEPTVRPSINQVIELIERAAPSKLNERALAEISTPSPKKLMTSTSHLLDGAKDEN